MNNENCTQCGSCAKVCPTEAITWRKKEFAVIDRNKCVKCRACILSCRFHAID
ncbi:MAG: 4Fe-4S binding protein [Desulfobacteraceae bacterium]|nr:4Fe-4S binding protein [Desulfobacteraceae bacterium]